MSLFKIPPEKRTPMARSPWNVVELFVLFLLASFIGELMGVVLGEGGQLGLALFELALGLGLAWPVFTGRTFGRWLMGAYLVYYGLATFWLLMEGDTDAVSWAYHLPLAFFFAAGGLKLMLTPLKVPGNDSDKDSETDENGPTGTDG